MSEREREREITKKEKGQKNNILEFLLFYKSKKKGKKLEKKQMKCIENFIFHSQGVLLNYLAFFCSQLFSLSPACKRERRKKEKQKYIFPYQKGEKRRSSRKILTPTCRQ